MLREKKLLKDPKITCFLIKIASRCNLNCDYCYVFNHIDQTWKSLPPLMSHETQHSVVMRIAEYAALNNLKSCLIIFHGGEPLLLKAPKICQMVENFRQVILEKAPETVVDFSLQTNGVLLKKEDLELFEKYNVGVSLSLDGPREANDLHRVTHKNKSSFDAVLKAYYLLKEYPTVFTGVLSVVDPRISPSEIFSFFNELSPPNLDFLLPDAHYNSLPALRDLDQDIYKNWLIDAFDLWFDQYSHIKVRLFDNLLIALMGTQSGTDFFGLGDVTLLSIETDGSYHDLDVLKITTSGQSSLGMSALTHSIAEAASSEQVQKHRKLLQKEGLSKTCQSCSVVDICGGGSVPHRFSLENGFNNPTIYCKEMFSLINHVRNKITYYLEQNNNSKVLDNNMIKQDEEFNTLTFNEANINSQEFKKIYENWINSITNTFNTAIEYAEGNIDHIKNELLPSKLTGEQFRYFVKSPSIQLWSQVVNKHIQGIHLYDLDEKVICINLNYPFDKIKTFVYETDEISIHKNDPWLRLLFGTKIIFESKETAQIAIPHVIEALDIIKSYKPGLYDEIKMISPVIQLIQDPTAHPDKLVSFSDNVVPGALYICIQVNNQIASSYDIAESIIHEHRHQKLYLLERYAPIVKSDFPYVKSPWREELRPVSGLFHAVFVFSEVEKYWQFVLKNNPTFDKKASSEIKNNQRMLREGLDTLLKEDNYTLIGKTLIDDFYKQLTI